MSNVSIDFEGADELVVKFNSMATNMQKKTIRSAFNKSIRILTNRAKKLLRQVVKGANRPSKKGRFKGRTLTKGIRYKVAKDVKSVKANILGDARLKWLEMGTKVRYTKGRKRALHSTGSVQPINFFTQAKRETESKVIDTLENEIEKQINKNWYKK